MPKLQLDYPADPFKITQAFGIYNPAYKPWGFDKHNGIDFAVDKDKIVNAMCEGTVFDVGYNSGAGNYVKYKTPLVNCEGTDCYVVFFYMHAEKHLVKEGDKVISGTPLMIAGNTGNSTGPHTHITAYRIDEKWNRLDMDDRTNQCFDWLPYLKGSTSPVVKSLPLPLRKDFETAFAYNRALFYYFVSKFVK